MLCVQSGLVTATLCLMLLAHLSCPPIAANYDVVQLAALGHAPQGLRCNEQYQHPTARSSLM